MVTLNYSQPISISINAEVGMNPTKAAPEKAAPEKEEKEVEAVEKPKRKKK